MSSMSWADTPPICFLFDLSRGRLNGQLEVPAEKMSSGENFVIKYTEYCPSATISGLSSDLKEGLRPKAHTIGNALIVIAVLVGSVALCRIYHNLSHNKAVRLVLSGLSAAIASDLYHMGRASKIAADKGRCNGAKKMLEHNFVLSRITDFLVTYAANNGYFTEEN